MRTLKLSDYIESYYYGKEGETLFHVPYPQKFGKIGDNSRDLIMTRDLQESSLDDRSLVLVSAMVSENYIDRILKLLLPTFKTDRAGGASDKINLLGAFNLLPRHLITATELLNKTRNQFAHNLMLSSFAQLDQHKPALIHGMRSICRTCHIQVGAGDNETKELFEVMFKMATTGIHYYEENVRFYTEFTRTMPFIKAIGEMQTAEVRSYNDALLEALRKHQSAPNLDDPPSVM